jgi:tetratricopeptide (TPR) repeat protein
LAGGVVSAPQQNSSFVGVSVAASLIVKDEQRFLPGCLESLRDRVDEIIVVDTGSSDASPRIAETFGAKLIRFPWADDFSAARNAGLNAASASWILYIDADERLRLPDGGGLGGYIDAGAIANYVRFRPKTGYTRYREPRLFRRDPRLRFVGRIHETVNPALREICAREGLSIVPSSVEIDHIGYDGDQSHKHARNLPLLESAVRAEPERVYYWHQLAETLAALGRSGEALEVAQRGLMAAERDDGDKQRADGSLVFQTMARLLRERGDDPLPLIDRGLARLPEDHGLRFLRGLALLDAARPLEALEVAERLRQLEPDDLDGGLLAFDRAIFREKACELAALSNLRLGRRDAAAGWFAQAFRLAPNADGYRLKAAALGRGGLTERQSVVCG